MGVCEGVQGSKFKNNVIRVKIGCESWIIVAVYGPGCEIDDEERESFWEKLCECLSESENKDRLLVCGNLDARVSEVEVEGIT